MNQEENFDSGLSAESIEKWITEPSSELRSDWFSRYTFLYAEARRDFSSRKEPFSHRRIVFPNETNSASFQQSRTTLELVITSDCSSKRVLRFAARFMQDHLFKSDWNPR
jgi:hypothetical protein